MKDIFGVLPSLVPVEKRSNRLFWFVAAAVVALFFFRYTQAFWVPANGGVDQNGYLVGGKMFARTLSMGQDPSDPYGFVGNMWISTPRLVYFPKYPLGLPFLYAVAIWISGAAHAGVWPFLVNPIAMTLALLGTYFLLRLAVNPYASLLGTLIVATSPVTLGLTNNPNSHATTLCCVTWGMFLLVRWWQNPRGARALWRARGAGLLLGYAFTIRYTEGMLLLPLCLAAFFSMRWRDWRSSRNSATLLFWWAVPVVILLMCNRFWFGDLTGYDSTNESTGFSFDYFRDNWNTTVRLLDGTALFFILPFALLGLAMLFAKSWRFALLLCSWVLPNILLYTAYYWAPDGGISYMRFYLTIFPALTLAAMWLLENITHSIRATRIGGIIATSVLTAMIAALVFTVHFWNQDMTFSRQILRWHPSVDLFFPAIGCVGLCAGGMLFAAIYFLLPQAIDTSRAIGAAAMGLIVAVGAAVNLNAGLLMIENDQRTNWNLQTGGELLAHRAPPGSIVFGENNLLHYTQFIADYRTYNLEPFDVGAIKKFARPDFDATAPQGLQPERAKMLYDMLSHETSTQLTRRQNGIMLRALDWGHPVFFVGPYNFVADVKRRFVTAGFTATIVDRWRDLPRIEEPDFIRKRKRGVAANRRLTLVATQEWQIMQITLAPPKPERKK